jgi:hypothetical protein
MEGVENYMGKRIFLKSILYHQFEQFLIGKVLTFRLIVNGKEFDFSIRLGKIGSNGNPTTHSATPQHL